MSTGISAPPDLPPTRPAPQRARRGARIRWVVVALTSLAIVGYVLAIYTQGSLATLSKTGAGLSTSYAGRALPIQAAFYCHITFAALALLIGPFQFVVAIRRRRPRLHRWIGRVFLVSVGAGSIAAGVMSLFNSAAIDGFFGFGTLALLWTWTAWRGYTCARAGDYASHQAWMIRCFALTYAGVTLRAWLGILIGVQLPFTTRPVDFDHVMTTAYAVLPFLSWLPNLVIAELLIRRRGLPALALTPSPTDPGQPTPDAAPGQCLATQRSVEGTVSLVTPPTPPAALDYDAIGEDFDRGISAIRPVADRLLDHLPVLPDGTTVIDLACGTGEPGLSLARQRPGVWVIGVDQAPGMIQVAGRKAERQSLGNVRFEVMRVEELALPTASIGGAVSRFGLLSFGDPTASAGELARVLTPTAPFSLAVWGPSTRNALLSSVITALRDRVSPSLLPPVQASDALAADGLREDCLRAARLSTVRTAEFQVRYDMPDVESVWRSMTGPGVFQQGFAALDEQGLRDARQDVERELLPFRTSDGRYSLPAEYRLFWGTR